MKYLHFWMALVYLLAVGFPAYLAIRHSNCEAQFLKKSYDTNNFANNGAIKEAEFWKSISAQHHFLGPIIKHFFSPTLNKLFKIPTPEVAQTELDQIPVFLQQAKAESATALVWSLALLGISLVYFGLTFVTRYKTQADPLFALTIISAAFLVMGILAPAMVIIVSPNTPIFPRFILHYQIRSIFGVISELYLSSYWFVAVCLTVFSVLIPFTKAGLTLFVLESRSSSRKLKIANFLHDISKWSMADVFVAAILLSNFAVRANKSTQADLFLGFYYFLGYCLLSMAATTWLQYKVRRGR
jgi:paraquat-inducible protein A